MTFKRPNRLGLYADVQQILDAALASNGGTYQCETYGQAVHWRQRAYQFRKLFADLHGAKQASAYDRLTLPRIHEGETCVHILVRKQVGTFTPNEAPTEQLPPVDDDLLAEAEALAARLSGNIL